MTNYILFDDPVVRTQLLPITYTRPISEIRIGILTIAEKWSKRLPQAVSFMTEKYLSSKFPLEIAQDNVIINGALCPNAKWIEAIQTLPSNTLLQKNGQFLAFRCDRETAKSFDGKNFSSQVNLIEIQEDALLITDPWHIFQYNALQIQEDFDLITKGRKSAVISDPHTIVYHPERVFVEKGADIKAAVLNASTGPIYIGKNTQVQEGSLIRGSFALCEGSHVNMGAKIKGDTTIGPHCKVGGEVSNSVILGFSNKGHDGFIGNSVIGEWCNLGADTNTSNLKNNYAPVKLWNYAKGGFKNTGLQFCGLIMGDHSKCGINTMFNTGTVVGVSANIFGSGFPRNFVPSFSWGGAHGFETFSIPKAFEVAERVMERRGKSLDQGEKDILQEIFDQSSRYRIWDKS